MRPLRQVSVDDVENCFNKEMLPKKVKFSLKWVDINLCSILQVSYPLPFKFFFLHLPSYGADYFDNVSSLTLLSKVFNLASKWALVLSSRWSGGVYYANFVKIRLTADAGDTFKNRVPLPPHTGTPSLKAMISKRSACKGIKGCQGNVSASSSSKLPRDYTFCD
jgi:hypothetical protein